MKVHKSSPLKRRKTSIRCKLKECSKLRLTVYKSNKHIYTQIYTYNLNKVLVSASSLDKDFSEKIKNINNKLNKTDMSRLVGFLLANKAKKMNITEVVFDRSGFKFHGRIKAVADSIKENGIKC